MFLTFRIWLLGFGSPTVFPTFLTMNLVQNKLFYYNAEWRIFLHSVLAEHSPTLASQNSLKNRHWLREFGDMSKSIIFFSFFFKILIGNVFVLFTGGDDRRVLLWSVPHAIHDQCNPIVMTTTHLSNIFCLGFDSQNSKIFSAGNDDNVIVHDLRT